MDACTTSPAEVGSGKAELSTTDWSRVIPWGSRDGQVGLEPGGVEHLAQGPSSLAVDSTGAVWILDRLNRRLVRLSSRPDDAAQIVAATDFDAEDFALGPDGAVALYSPLRSRIVVQDGSDRRAEMAIPGAIQDVVGLALGKSRQLTLFTADQEFFRLGSPSVPQILSAVLHSKREGAARLQDGSSVMSLRHPDGSIELQHRVADGEPSRLALPGPALSARVVGVSHGIACMRIERNAATADAIERRAVCLDLARGSTVLDVELGTPGLYVPRRELAVGGGAASAVLAFLRPEESGLRVTVRSLAVANGGGR
jgi:hypothetical protein